VQDVVLVAYPQVEHAAQHHDDFLVRIVGVGLGTGPTAGLDRGHDHLQAPGHVRREELVDGAQARVCHPAACRAPHDPAGLGLLGEQLRDRQPQRLRDPVDRGDRRARDVALDLRQEALRDPGPIGHVAQRQVASLAQGSDASAQLQFGDHGRPPGRSDGCDSPEV
jgi:hypothetical protein